MKNTKVEWLCLIRQTNVSGAREEQWVRGVIRPYRQGVKQAVERGGLVFFSNIQAEVLLRELPQWKQEAVNPTVWVGVDTEYAKDLGVNTGKYSWLLLNTASDNTTSTRFNKYYGFTASTGTTYPTNLEPPVTTMPDVIRLEQAEDNLRSMLFVMETTIEKYN